MSKRLNAVLVLLLSCLILVPTGSADNESTPLITKGSPVAEDATGLRDLSGKPRKLDEFVGGGKWRVVMIWASDCYVCNVEARQYVDFHNARSGKDVALLGLSLDGWSGRADAEAFIKRHNVTYPNLLGSPQAIANLFFDRTGENLTGTPAFLIFSPQGKIVAKQVGAVPVKIIAEFIAQF